MALYSPIADVVDGGWTTQAGATLLYPSVAEEPADDTSYIQSVESPADDAVELRYAAATDPGMLTGHSVRYRLRGDKGTKVTVSLMCGGAIVKSWTHDPAPLDVAEFDQALQPFDVALITDYADLRLRVVANQVSVGDLVVDSAIAALPANTAIDLAYLFDAAHIPFGEFIAEVASLTGNGGCAWDARRGQLLVWSGGHADTNYNAVLKMQLTDPKQLVEDYLPTPAQPDMVYSNYEAPPVGGVAQPGRGCFLGYWDESTASWKYDSATEGPYPRPATRHTSGQLIVWEDELIAGGVVEGNGRYSQQAVNDGDPGAEYVFNCKGQIPHYIIPEKRWEFENASPTQTDGEGGSQQWGAMQIDPPSGLILWMSYVGLYTYDPVSRVKRQIIRWGSPDGAARLVNESGAVVPNTLDITSSLCYNPHEDKHYWFCSNLRLAATGLSKWPTNEVFQPWRLDLDRSQLAQGLPGTTKLVKLVTSGTRPDMNAITIAGGATRYYVGCGEQFVRYDSHNRIFGTGPWNKIFYAFDSATKSWSARTVNGFTGNNVAYLSHMCDYAPDPFNLWVFVTDWNDASKSHFWGYRYA